MDGRRRRAKRGSKSKVAEQLELRARTWGGRRKGAGRKPGKGRRTVAHRVRPGLDCRHPLHVTLRVRDGVPSLRRRNAWATIVRAFRDHRGRFGLTVVEYAVLGNHIHLLVEIAEPDSLRRGMRSLCTMLAMRINAVLGCSGKLFPHRYHARALTSPLAVRRGLAYVLLNARKHAAERGRKFAASWIDPRSTAARFTGWRQPVRSAFVEYDFGTAPARTWLLRVGWKRHGPLAIDEVPGEHRGASRI